VRHPWQAYVRNIKGLGVENHGDVRLLGRKATFTLGKRAASGHHRRRQPALHPRLPSTCIPLPIMWAAVEETGVGALGALAVGAVAVPAMEETGALPRTPSGGIVKLTVKAAKQGGWVGR
jgi:hypothetical protein